MQMYITRAVVRVLVTVGEVVCNPLSIPSPKKTYPRYRAINLAGQGRYSKKLQRLTQLFSSSQLNRPSKVNYVTGKTTIHMTPVAG